MQRKFYSLAATLIITFTFLSSANLQAGDVCGDANGDAIITISDAVHLINYIFAGGAAPVCGTGPSEIGTVTDIEGNLYYTAKIGDQWWMIENLKVTHYRNGEPVANVTGNSEWSILSTGAYCDYDNNPANVATYGRLYNWYAVADSRNIAPAGWHVPTDDEWKQLEMHLGMPYWEANAIGEGRGTVEGGMLKEEGTILWLSPNSGATNETGFTALPGGNRSLLGTFHALTSGAYFWTSTEIGSSTAWPRYLLYNHSQIDRNTPNKLFGFSVRCVRD